MLIDVSGMDTVGGGFMNVLWWILGIAAGLGIDRNRCLSGNKKTTRCVNYNV